MVYNFFVTADDSQTGILKENTARMMQYFREYNLYNGWKWDIKQPDRPDREDNETIVLGRYAAKKSGSCYFGEQAVKIEKGNEILMTSNSHDSSNIIELFGLNKGILPNSVEFNMIMNSFTVSFLEEFERDPYTEQSNLPLEKFGIWKEEDFDEELDSDGVQEAYSNVKHKRNGSKKLIDKQKNYDKKEIEIRKTRVLALALHEYFSKFSGLYQFEMNQEFNTDNILLRRKGGVNKILNEMFNSQGLDELTKNFAEVSHINDKKIFKGVRAMMDENDFNDLFSFINVELLEFTTKIKNNSLECSLEDILWTLDEKNFSKINIKSIINDNEIIIDDNIAEDGEDYLVIEDDSEEEENLVIEDDSEEDMFFSDAEEKELSDKYSKEEKPKEVEKMDEVKNNVEADKKELILLINELRELNSTVNIRDINWMKNNGVLTERNTVNYKNYIRAINQLIIEEKEKLLQPKEDTLDDLLELLDEADGKKEEVVLKATEEYDAKINDEEQQNAQERLALEKGEIIFKGTMKNAITLEMLSDVSIIKNNKGFINEFVIKIGNNEYEFASALAKDGSVVALGKDFGIVANEIAAKSKKANLDIKYMDEAKTLTVEQFSQPMPSKNTIVKEEPKVVEKPTVVPIVKESQGEPYKEEKLEKNMKVNEGEYDFKNKNTQLKTDYKMMEKNIPVELKQRNQWVVWKLMWRPEKDKAGNVVMIDGKEKGTYNKVPVQPIKGLARTIRNGGNIQSLVTNGGKMAMSNNPETWGTFEDALATAKLMGKGAGIGIELGEKPADDSNFKGLVVIDLDHIKDENGNWSKQAQEFLNYFSDKTYIEMSPSKTGLHIVFDYKGNINNELMNGAIRPNGIEVYTHSRFITFTGNQLENVSSKVAYIESQEEKEVIGEILKPYIPKEKARNKAAALGSVTFDENEENEFGLDDEQVVNKLIAAGEKQKEKKEKQSGKEAVNVPLALLDGDIIAAGYADASEADYRLAGMLYAYTTSPAQIKRIMEASGLDRDKYDTIGGGISYLERTITNAMAHYNGWKYSDSRLYQHEQAKQIRLKEIEKLKGLDTKQLIRDFMQKSDEIKKIEDKNDKINAWRKLRPYDNEINNRISSCQDVKELTAQFFEFKDNPSLKKDIKKNIEDKLKELTEGKKEGYKQETLFTEEQLNAQKAARDAVVQENETSVQQKNVVISQ